MKKKPTKYFFCSFEYLLIPSAVGFRLGATNSGRGTLVVKGTNPNPVDTIVDIKSRHPEYSVVIPVLFHEIDESMYNDYFSKVAK